MRHLVIDRGNSSCKWAFFDSEQSAPSGYATEPTEIFHTLSSEILDEAILNRFTPEACICSSVAAQDASLEAWLRSHVPYCLTFDRNTPIPLRNAYRTPQTLGPDRLAAAVGAWTLAPGQPSLIVDMGTAVTYDLLTADGVFRGGNIAPGIWLRFKALHENTAALPMVEAQSDFPYMGTDTETAIRAGVLQGIWNELEGYIRHYSVENEGLLTFLTGGDIIYFENQPKNRIFALKNLVLTGLERILTDNVLKR